MKKHKIFAKKFFLQKIDLLGFAKRRQSSCHWSNNKEETCEFSKENYTHCMMERS